MLAEMNAKFLSSDNVDDPSANILSIEPILYTGPPPSMPTPYTPTIPLANVLAQSIISNSDKLFLISSPIGSGKVHDWCLIWLALEASMSSYSSCLVNRQYLVIITFAIQPTSNIMPSNNVTGSNTITLTI
jgi:hypothetical protein